VREVTGEPMTRRRTLSIGLALAIVSTVGAVNAAAEPAPTCFGQPATIVGTDGRDVIHGTPGDDVIVTGDGPDDVFAGAGDDLICGGGGSFEDDEAIGDRLHGGPGRDRIDGGPGNDLLFGNSGNDDLYGRTGEDVLDDGSGDDRAYGSTGSDEFVAGGGDDRLVGGPASEPANQLNGVTYLDSHRGVTIDLRADTAVGFGHDVVKHIWRATGSQFNDVIRGTPKSDVIYGGCGDDRVYGRGGGDRLYGHADDGDRCKKAMGDNDVINGGSGNDFFQGEFYAYIGTDKVHGGGGRDQLYTLGGREHFFGGEGADGFFGITLGYPKSMHVDLAAGTYRIDSNRGTLHSVAEVVGTQQDDVLLGGSHRDYLYGNEGVDVVRGRGGNDVLRGDFWDGQESMWKDKAYGGSGTDNCRAEVKHSCERHDTVRPPF
jgi:Ca2+-binding RTX toxin-like protein